MMDGVRVVDRTTDIAGPYCTKILVDAGAVVVRTTPEADDPIARHRSGRLFEYLNEGKHAPTTSVADAIAAADVVVTSDGTEATGLHRAHPSLVVVCITPFGIDGPWVGRPTTEFTLQAACGSTGSRGDPDGPPLAAGGRVGEWVTGTYAAVATIAAVGIDGSRRLGRLVDVAMLDCMAIALVTYPSVFASFAGWPPIRGTGRTVEVPSIEPTADGYAVFTTNSPQQLEDFMVMIGRPDWLDDRGFKRVGERFARRREFLDAVHRYTKARSTADVLEDAGTYRIPAAPVLNGSTVAEFEHFRERGVFISSVSGRFRQPRPPYRISPPPSDSASTPGAEPRGNDRGLPLAGIRVLDCTGWWAGPSATHVLACLGADVIKVEASHRPDPMRTASTRSPNDPEWLEWSPIFHAANSSKRGITLDLATPDGVAAFEQLATTADLVVENYTPRVMEQFGLGWERLHELNPRLIMVRMPAFGLDGPWRDRTGFAQTMESIAGMAWLTGFADQAPVLVRGACDPVAGLHAVIAAMLALRARSADGEGRLVEATMVEAALNITAEQLIEWDVSRVILGRDGNRGQGAPQGVYRCEGDDEWVAIAVEDDQQWRRLSAVLGVDGDPWKTTDARRAAADELDEIVGRWTRSRASAEIVDMLVGAGVPAAVVVPARDIVHNPQLRHRRLFEVEEHPVTGRHELPTMPFRFSDVDAWLSTPAPTLGQHNAEVLGAD